MQALRQKIQTLQQTLAKEREENADSTQLWNLLEQAKEELAHKEKELMHMRQQTPGSVARATVFSAHTPLPEGIGKKRHVRLQRQYIGLVSAHRTGIIHPILDLQKSAALEGKKYV